MHTSNKNTTCPTAARVAGTRLPCYAFASNRELARSVAQAVAGVIRERGAAGQKAVIGLTTGSTPLGIYRELIRMHREEGLDFANVVTFNPDEYFGVPADQSQSRRRWMQDHFFAHVNIPAANIHFLDGIAKAGEVDEVCRRFDEAIDAVGGIDIQLLGIGRNGHIAANEPYSARHAQTRLATLDPLTRKDAAGDFFGDENVPMQALTLGLDKLFQARKIFLVALGEHKAAIIRDAVEGAATERVPASFLQQHADVVVVVDSAAGSQLTGLATPWLTGPIEWDDLLIRRAVLWLSLTVGKPLLKLNDDDFRSQNLHQLLALHGPAHAVAHRVFRMMMDTINYHPGGRTPQRVVCFSPHPDDDVISMGGALIRLVEDRHEVHVAYMTNGNIAVFDHDAQQVADLVTEYNRLFGIDNERTAEVERCVHESLAAKKPGRPDGDAVAKIKALIRWSEAKAGAAVVGCREEHLHFLDLPFYRTGTVAKNPVGDDDVRIILELLERVRPEQVYIAGDLSDPHGTHRVCAEAVFRALWEMEQQTGSRPEALLYRGAWQEWPPHEIEIAVPLSPRDLELKKQAIFRHESQKDEALFPGSDEREFWQRAEDRNRGTADIYNRLGLPEYYALEGFVRWNGKPL
jgi:glucosamine-6-phosphate deaminase